MPNWQVTATSVYCDNVDDEVTIMVYKDWSVKCTGYKKYGAPNKEAINLLKKRRKQLNRELECAGLECDRIIQYKEKLFSEEPKEE